MARQEAKFNNQQALQVQLSTKSIEDAFARIPNLMDLFAAYSVSMFSDEVKPIVFQYIVDTLISESYLDIVAVGFYKDPNAQPIVYADSDQIEQVEQDTLTAWVNTYWDTVATTGDYVVTPFTITTDSQYYGVLHPVESRSGFDGVMVVAVDFKPLLERYIIPVRSGEFGAAWIHDNTGLVIYDHEPETVGQNVHDIAASYPDLARTIADMLARDSGQDEYHYTIELGGKVHRKLVAWDTAHLGNQRLTIALSAPDTEVNADVAFFRRQTLLLGMLLGITLVISAWAIFQTQQHRMEKLVASRTLELEQLNNQLEQRVLDRTAELDQERAQLRAILDAMGDGLIYYENNQIKYHNQALTELLNIPPGQLREHIEQLSSSITATKGIVERLPNQPGATRAGRHVWRREMKLRRVGGSEFDAELTVAQVRNSNDRHLGSVSVIRDISQHKALQAEKDRFIANASHELRTPLSNLKTRLYLMRHQPNKLSEHLDVIEDVSNMMIALVEDLLDVTRFKRGDIRIQCQPLVLQDMIQNVIHVQEHNIERKNVSVITDFPPEPVVVQADPRRLRQMLSNLILTAITFTGAHEQVDVQLTIDKKQEPNWAVIRIQDHGPDISDYHVAHLFEPFSRSNPGNSLGTGLGLTIAKAITDLHGGHITAESRPGRGNAYMVKLLLSTPDELNG
ncbi:MAG: PAS domain S-box protein [Anaerolineae bacterium]|nr:PAS domain S-box protein [Anaerolineae bacterium]